MALQNEDDCKRFITDLLTPLELEECVNRWAIATLILQGSTHDAVVKHLGVSSATVSRVNNVVKHGKVGYKRVWETMKE